MKDIIDLIARILIGGYFLYEAFDKAQSISKTKATMDSYGIVWQQDLLIYGTLFLLVVGSILVLVGYRPGLGAVLLLLYLIPLTLIAHSFWNDPPTIRMEELSLFMKNITIIGALLILYVNGTGRFSVRRLFATTKVNY